MGAPRRAVGTALTVSLLAACGTSRFDEPPPAGVGAAREVTVLGDMSESDAATIDWALERFELAGLQLPRAIEFEFDRTRESCDGGPGTCRPSGGTPRVTICQKPGTFAQTLMQRITLLHEIAHVWHFAQGDGTSWPDRRAIVGGVTDTGPDDDVAWADRTEERVAVVVTWGLLDQLRRPVRSRLPCRVLYSQFVQLTGVRPVGPLEPACYPNATPEHASPGDGPTSEAASTIAIDWGDAWGDASAAGDGAADGRAQQTCIYPSRGVTIHRPVFTDGVPAAGLRSHDERRPDAVRFPPWR